MKDPRTGRLGKENHPLILNLIEKGATASQVADLLDVNPETVRKFARTRGISIERFDMSGESHPSWKGGTTVDRSGYILRRVPVDGPYGYLIRAIASRGKAGTDPAGYAPVHRIVMHDIIGRPLVKGETVDHIDGNKQNNAPENLRLYQTNADHLRETLKGKVPNWTPEGKSRMTGRPPRRREKATLP
jgi:hypothetical protein